MKSLYLRIWLTVVVTLALFAIVTGWLIQSHLARERAQKDAELTERMAGWGEMIRNSLPEASEPAELQAEALREWAHKLRVPMALDDAHGQRLGASDDFNASPRADGPFPQRTPVAIPLDDGRILWMGRPPRRGPGTGGPGPERGEPPPNLGLTDRGLPDFDSPPPPTELRRFIPPLPWFTRDLTAMISLLALLFVAVAAGAYPVVRRLTRRLEHLQQGVEAFGAGELGQRVRIEGRDEVARLAGSFNQAAERIETLIRSNQSLLANASHELRSPLARLKMAVAMWADAPPDMQTNLHREINANIRELDALVDEVLLSSRLEAGAAMTMDDRVDLLGLAAEEGARVGAEVQGETRVVLGSDRLLRRALRNLLENARRYAGDDIAVHVQCDAAGRVCVAVCDRGPGVPESERERIFEPFYRMSGHAEREGGVGLGLALVRQIAQRHGGNVVCTPREGGGSCFMLTLPAQCLQA
jgi:signal transduction histidine kinase